MLATIIMKRNLGWLFYTFSLLILIIKFIIVTKKDIQGIMIDYDQYESFLGLLLSSIILFGYLIFPILALLGIIGFIFRNVVGLVLALILPYFIISNMIINTGYELSIEIEDLAQLFFSGLVIIPLNLPWTYKLFNNKLKALNLLKLNIISLAIGIFLNIALQAIISSYLH
jgi:hypothetical protein